ncbi:MAG: hypothetical protein IKK79_04195 [Spirochaetaceae bacterium]|nr:hypothetical protein [Spirochaetaceae bacterium]
MDSYSSFDRMVISLTPAERASMLEKVQAIVNPESQSLASVEMQGPKIVPDIELQLKNESFFVRIWLMIKSVFTNTDIKTLYNAQIVVKKGHNIEKTEPGLIDITKRVFLKGFYDQVEQLSRCADFFTDGIEIYDADQGGFYVFLSSLIAPEINGKIAEEMNPLTLPFSREVTSELRLSMIRNLESTLQSMPSIKRAALYSAVCNTEWIRQFVHLPFNRILAAFTEENGQLVCPFDSVKNEISQFAKVLCNGKTIQSEVLEAFFVLSYNLIERNKENFSEKTSKYMEEAASNISLIKMFISTVPLRSLGSVVWFDAFWVPDKPEGSEDWFVKFKSAWRRNFDKQWDQWIAARKKHIAEDSMRQVFGFKSLPVLPYRPWKKILGGISFMYDYVMGFLSAFYDEVYPEYSKLLKIIMVEGVFYQKENLIELTDVCSELDKQRAALNKFKASVAPTGEGGIMFENLMKENLLDPRDKAKLDSLLKSLETDAALILAQWCASARTIELIIKGIITGARNARYDTLSNLSSIQGQYNEKFRHKLDEMQYGFERALEIIKDLETIR